MTGTVALKAARLREFRARRGALAPLPEFPGNNAGADIGNTSGGNESGAQVPPASSDP